MTTRLLHHALLVLPITLWALAGPAGAAEANKPEKDRTYGYDDTPLLPGQKWRVADVSRPMAPVVASGSRFSENAAPPADALVLFDGTDLSKWKSGNGPARWKVENGYMEVVAKSGSIETRDQFGDFQLHLEWMAPDPPQGVSQQRGNSGVFLHGRYEIQILDSYQSRTYADGAAGAIYGQYPPLVNPARPPGQWQTFDVIFETPQWDAAGKLIKPALVTLLYNGVVVHHRAEILGDSRHAELARYTRYNGRGPISLQDHSYPVRFRNIWLRPLHPQPAP